PTLIVPAYRPELTRPEGLPERVGGFRVRGALRWDDGERVLLAEDPQLGRTVWVWLRAATEPPLASARRDVARAARPRWVASGVEGAWQWDAFLAPAGTPLPVVAGGGRRLSWTAARPLLEDLTDELTAAADGSLPASLTLPQVWVQPDGRVQLLDTPLATPG